MNSISFTEAYQLAKEDVDRLSGAPVKYQELLQSIKVYKSPNDAKLHKKFQIELSTDLVKKPDIKSLDLLNAKMDDAAKRRQLLLMRDSLKIEIEQVRIIFYLYFLHLIICKNRSKRLSDINRRSAARKISKWYKAILVKKKESKKLWAISVILPIILKFVETKRIKKQQRNAIIVYSYIKETYESGFLINLIHTYQLKVLKCQVLTRNFLSKKHAKIQLRLLQIEQFEKKGKRRRHSIVSNKNTRILQISDLLKIERENKIYRSLFTNEDLLKYFEF
eukprot:NODE_24_length_41419_cov_0.818780.p16 type:complete len:278 gc:universal NODE_24_length_41419_cov_0.818780:34468-35301(+)